MIGPGKYNEVVTAVRVLTNAKGVLLVIVDGNQGNGCCFQFEKGAGTKADMRAFVKGIRTVADQMEVDIDTITGEG